jgi:hypothetical protein
MLDPFGHDSWGQHNTENLPMEKWSNLQSQRDPMLMNDLP